MALAWALSQVEQGWQRHAAHQLRRVPREGARDVGGRARREHVVELRARHRRAGARTAAATAAAVRAGTSAGGGRCATRSTGCATRPPARSTTSARLLFHDPWAARDAYIDVVLGRDPGARDAFLAAPRVARARSPDERVRALSLMEMARHAMLMYTSCGWFFDELVGDRDRAVHAVRGARRGADRERRRRSRRARARRSTARSRARTSPDEGDGRQVWAQRVLPGADRSGEGLRRTSRCTRSSSPTPAAASTSTATTCELPRSDRAAQRARADGRGDACACARQLTEAATLAVLRRALPRRAARHRRRASTAARRPSGRRSLDELTGALKTADVFAAQRAIDRHFPGAQLSLVGAVAGQPRARARARCSASRSARPRSSSATRYDEHAPLIRWLVAHELPVPDVLHTIAEVDAAPPRAREPATPTRRELPGSCAITSPRRPRCGSASTRRRSRSRRARGCAG